MFQRCSRPGCEHSSHESRHREAKMTGLGTSAAHSVVHKFMLFTCFQVTDGIFVHKRRVLLLDNFNKQHARSARCYSPPLSAIFCYRRRAFRSGLSSHQDRHRHSSAFNSSGSATQSEPLSACRKNSRGRQLGCRQKWRYSPHLQCAQ